MNQWYVEETVKPFWLQDSCRYIFETTPNSNECVWSFFIKLTNQVRESSDKDSREVKSWSFYVVWLLQRNLLS